MASEEDDYSQDSGSDEAEEAAADYSAACKPYRILKEEDIKLFQENDISAVSSFLSVSRGVACSLLCENNWCLASVYEKWFAAADDRERNPNPAVDSAKQLICNICHENTPLPKEVVSASCGHPFCADCWKTYVATAVSDGATCLTLQCPEPGCRGAVISDIVEKLASEADIGRYQQYLRRSYVELNRSIKWCPGAGCDRAVEFEFEFVFGSESYDVVCDCSHKFCWRCGEEWHRPVDCEAAVEWLKMNRSEGANTTWILYNTKPCPKCELPIEKNQGGNLITCESPCKFEFCWICGEAWNRDHLNCNKNEGVRWRMMKAKRLEDRYVDCYLRWYSNDKSIKIAMDNLDKARRKYVGQWRMQFVVRAWEQVVECRRVLKWIDVYGYYLSEEDGKKTELFEHLQGQAETELEKLHHCVEKEIVDDECFYADFKGFSEFKGKLMNSTSVTRDYFEKLVMALENDFAHG